MVYSLLDLQRSKVSEKTLLEFQQLMGVIQYSCPILHSTLELFFDPNTDNVVDSLLRIKEDLYARRYIDDEEFVMVNEFCAQLEELFSPRQREIAYENEGFVSRLGRFNPNNSFEFIHGSYEPFKLAVLSDRLRAGFLILAKNFQSILSKEELAAEMGISIDKVSDTFKRLRYILKAYGLNIYASTNQGYLLDFDYSEVLEQ